MAITNHERVGRALELLRDGLLPFVTREMEHRHGKHWVTHATASWTHESSRRDHEPPNLDSAALLRIMAEQWNEVFHVTLGGAERSLVDELRDWRTRWAHQKPLSTDDTYRALDSATRLLMAIAATRQADEVARMKMHVMRVRIEEHDRTARRKVGGTPITVVANGGLTPWRDIMPPHPDVASGRYQHAEFAADLWHVHLGEGSDEYRDPVEFFRRTYLTESLRHVLVNAAKRLSGKGGDPVIQVQTGFGGGKTHTMLALYHMASGRGAADLPGVDVLLRDANVVDLPSRVRRVVLVGNRISPGNPVVKPDGTVVRTLWGELAYQLGGRDAYARIADDDAHATNPGDRLRELFDAFAPCLILIDEWVAYARQLHERNDLPGGRFETQFTFAQALTESAKLANRCLLAVSLPASTPATATAADDVEVGGVRGREALDRLRHVIGRVESSWRPATAEEGVAIVRQRLFHPIVSADGLAARNAVARAFANLYAAYPDAFPRACRERAYERRIQETYPFHPDVVDRLLQDWSTLLPFQRTRGALRFLASVVHCLWERGDRSPLILPSLIPLDDRRVRSEATRSLADPWTQIIDHDVDGPHALPLVIDRETPQFGKVEAARRVARTIFLGSAPTASTMRRGVDVRRIQLGCVMPGEQPHVFEDAVRRLSNASTYLYRDDVSFWYDTRPTVVRLAKDRAEQLRHDQDTPIMEVERRLLESLRKTRGALRVHALPRSSESVPDEPETRLVALSPERPYRKAQDNAAAAEASRILEYRGATPRRYRNTLVFLAADHARLRDLIEAVCEFLAWDSILKDRDVLDLSPSHVRQAEAQRQQADQTVDMRIMETYCWLLIPEQKTPSAPITWNAQRINGAGTLADRAFGRMVHDETMLTRLGATVLRDLLDRIPLWRGDHVAVMQLVEDFASYLYLPRVQTPDVVINAINDGVASPTWASDTFAYAEAIDAQTGRYVGVHAGERLGLTLSRGGYVVKSEKAPPSSAFGSDHAGADAGAPNDASAPAPRRSALRRFRGSVRLCAERPGRDAARIAEEVIAHLIGSPRARAVMTLDIEVDVADAFPDHVIRIVRENGRALGFVRCEFAED